MKTIYYSFVEYMFYTIKLKCIVSFHWVVFLNLESHTYTHVF